MPSMGDEEFSRWVDLLERRTGVVVPPGRKTFLVTGVRTRMRETGYDSFERYFNEVLNGARGAIEWSTLVDRLTVHETRFFRHQPSLQMIASEWLPDFLKEHPDNLAMHAWSVGCSTGEEAYSLAMVLDSSLRQLGASRAYFGVTATDISNAALAIGRGGLYPRERLVEIPDDMQKTYCELVGTDSFAINEALKKRVGFALFNIMDVARAPLKKLDLIYCQNVLIYFARDRRKQLLTALADLLKPGGMLVLGAGEVIGFTHPSLTRIGNRQTLAFRRSG
ncbi:methyltransferase [Ahniella affigens]|uniref:protein-glutamate O-methyltransferase n=2 Tax=Ahniella affigens TaxID=2021234 RepID=A0A2P1PTP4_9GAMM|nr:methyltransferase [Ahniella affigens]